jgi:hypothetical protein
MKKQIKEGYTRVSEVLSLFSDLKSIPPDILANAASRGTAVHFLCESLVLNHVDDMEEIVREYTRNEEHFQKELIQVNHLVNSFKKWSKGKAFANTLDRLYDEELMLTGEVDLVYRDERGYVLVDLKTPASESKSWLLQGSAYHQMANKSGWRVDVIEFVKLSKTGKDPIVYVYKPRWDLFKAVLDTYRYYNIISELPSDVDYL